MRARIPAGIDLEDKLLYGLSPARLGYVTVAVVAAIWAIRQPAPLALRVAAGLVLLAAGGAAGWMRRDGRHLDSWAVDLVRHLVRRYRIELRTGRAGARSDRRPSRWGWRWRRPGHRQLSLPWGRRA